MTSQAPPQWATKGGYIHIRMLGDHPARGAHPRTRGEQRGHAGAAPGAAETQGEGGEPRRHLLLGHLHPGRGLQGIEMGTHLIKQAVTRLHEEFSAMTTISTLSPIASALSSTNKL